MKNTKSFLLLLFIAWFSIPVYAQKAAKNFVWGINGHPLTQVAYRNSIDDQVKYLKDLGLNSYRFDVLLDADGYAKNESAFNNLNNRLASNNIASLPVLMQSGLKDLDADAIYQVSVTQGKNFATRYGKYLSVIEVNNEADNKMMLPGNPTGSKARDYNMPKANKIIAAIKGFIDGVKSVNSSIQVTLSVSYVHYYYLQLLADNKVNYDIIGCHWYSNMGDIDNAKPFGDNVLKIVKQRFNKAIWLTEFNYSKGTLKASYAQQSSYLSAAIPRIISPGIISGLFIYELFDQPDMQSKDPNESQYGLVLKDANNNYVLKDGYGTFKQMIRQYQ